MPNDPKFAAFKHFVMPTMPIVDKLQDAPLVITDKGIEVTIELSLDELVQFQHLLSAVRVACQERV
jgi:hypothetical protein